MAEGLEPANPSARFRRFFAWYSRRMFRRDFTAVRLASGTRGVLEDAGVHDGPVMIAMNHASWWDPLLGLVLTDAFLGDRGAAAPMELDQLRKFGFMKRLGIFGIDPEHPDAMTLLVDHACGLLESDPRGVIALTPQGEFADVRVPVRLRPGAAAIAARAEGMLVVALACEYGFWHERTPEVFVRARVCGAPDADTTGAWHRALTRAMRENQGALGELVMARDPAGFTVWLGKRSGGAHPVYDALQRARGSDARVTPRGKGKPS